MGAKGCVCNSHIEDKVISERNQHLNKSPHKQRLMVVNQTPSILLLRKKSPLTKKSSPYPKMWNSHGTEEYEAIHQTINMLQPVVS